MDWSSIKGIELPEGSAKEIDIDGTVVWHKGGGEPVWSCVQASSLSEAKCELAAASTLEYALFGGGAASGSTSSLGSVDAYDCDLIRTIPTTLSVARRELSAESNSEYVLFAGGAAGSRYSKTVDAYDNDLVRSVPTALTNERYLAGSAHVGTYILFAGGNSRYTVDVYDTDLTKSTATALSQSDSGSIIPSTQTTNYAIFDTNGSIVNAYATDLTRVIPTAFPNTTRSKCGGFVGNYALFAGGTRSGSRTRDVYVYDNQLIQSNAPPLMNIYMTEASATIEIYALFAGGRDELSSYSKTVEAYDDTLTRSEPAVLLSEGRDHIAAVSIGIFALFGGGNISYNNMSSTVDAISYTT